MNAILSSLPVLGHVLIGLYFVFFGIWNIYHWRPTIDVMLEDKIPSPILLMSIGVSCQIILGAIIMSNIQIKIAALLLIVFTLFSVFMFHPFWKYKSDKRKYHMNKFADNLTVTMGALILLLNNIEPLSQISDLLN
jgi:putative oxidoreductase